MTDFCLHLTWLTAAMSSLILLILLFMRVFGNKFSARCRYSVWMVVIFSLCIGVVLFKMPSLFVVQVDLPYFDEITSELPKGDLKPIDTHTVFDDEISNPDIIIPDVQPGIDNQLGVIQGTNNIDENIENLPSYIPTVTDDVEIIPEESKIISSDIPEIPQPINIPLLIVIVWEVGALAFLTYGIAGYLSTVRKYDRAKSLCTAETKSVYNIMCGRYKIQKAPRIYVCSDVNSPVLYGYFKPVILLPDIELTENSLAGIFAHELTHYRRGDIWVKLFCLLAGTLHWFNPLAHIAAKHCNNEMELSCDECVLWGMDEAVRRSYGNVVLEIVRKCKPKNTALTTHFNPNKKAVKTRIMNILDMKNKFKGRVLITIILAFCIVVGTVVGCAVDNGNDMNENTEETTENADVSSTAEDIERVYVDTVLPDTETENNTSESDDNQTSSFDDYTAIKYFNSYDSILNIYICIILFFHSNRIKRISRNCQNTHNYGYQKCGNSYILIRSQFHNYSPSDKLIK